MRLNPHFSHTFEPRGVAHARLRAASALLPTPGLDAMLLAGDGVEMSLDTARRCVRHVVSRSAKSPDYPRAAPHQDRHAWC